MAFVIGVGLLAAWGDAGTSDESALTPNAWPAAARSNYLTACDVTSGGETDYCLCSWNETQASFTVSEFAALEAQYANTGALPSEFDAIINRCAGELTSQRAAPAPVAPNEIIAAVEAVQEEFENSWPEFAVSATTWRTVPDDLFGESLCVTIAWENVGGVEGALATYNFSLVGPSGQVKQPAYLVGGSVPPTPPTVVQGATGDSELCFVSDGERGQFTIRYADESHDQFDQWNLDIQ